MKEVSDSIKQLASGKAPGNDGIPSDVYKYGGQKLIKKLHQLFKTIWIHGQVPQDFKDANMQQLYKNKGNQHFCDNSRGISLLCIAGKILARLILNRITENLIDDIYPESQCGFRSGRRTIDMIFSLRQVDENVRKKNGELFMVFVDFWVPDKMLIVIVAFHQGMKGTVISDGNASNPFDVSNGTKQGCVLAPVLFFSEFFSDDSTCIW